MLITLHLSILKLSFCPSLHIINITLKLASTWLTTNSCTTSYFICKCFANSPQIIHKYCIKKSMAPSTLLWLSLLQTLTFVNIALPTVTLNLLILKNLNPVVCCLWLYFSYKKYSWLTVLKALWKAKYIMSTG